MAFTEKDCNDGKVLEICTMEQLEKDLPRNWIPKRKCQEKLSEFFENPFMRKDDDFLKSPVEAPVHRKYLWKTKTRHPKHSKPLMNYARNFRISYPRTVATLGRPC